MKTVKLTCQGSPVYLTGVQIPIEASTTNAPLSVNSLLPQPCLSNYNKTFVIDRVGYQSSDLQNTLIRLP